MEQRNGSIHKQTDEVVADRNDDDEIEFEVFNESRIGITSNENNIGTIEIVEKVSQSSSSYVGIPEEIENEDQIEIETTGSSSHASTIQYENDKHAKFMEQSEQKFMNASVAILKTSEFDHLFEHTSQENEKERKEKDRRIIGHLIRRRISNILKVFDGIGESVDGPQIRRKTVMGSLISIVMRFLVIILIAWKMYKVLSMNRSEDIGSIITMNYNRSDSIYFLDVPTLQMNISSKILFFERVEDGPSLQRIDIMDTHGLEKTFSTLSPSESIALRKPITKSVFGNANIGLNTFFPRNRDAETGFDSVNTFSTKMSVVSSIVDPAEALFIQSNQDRDFIEHTVHLYLRFLDNLRSIKPCQLQIGLINSGILSLLQDSDEYGNIVLDHQLQSHEDVYFASDPSTWTLSNNIPKEIERVSPKVLSEGISKSQFYLTTNFTKSRLVTFLSKKTLNGNVRNIAQLFLDRGISLPLFNEWTFIINYMNNFIYTSNKLVCDDYEQDIGESTQQYPRFILNNSFIKKKLFPNTIKIISNLVEEDSTVLLAFMNGNFSHQPPFSIIVAGYSGYSEVVRVSNIEMHTVENTNKFVPVRLIVERTTSTPFNKVDIYSSDFFREKVFNYQAIPNLPHSLPISWIEQGLWRCSPEKYGDGFCDCECGFHNSSLVVRDIDCNDILPKLFKSYTTDEDLIYNLSNVSCTERGLLCSMEGECVSTSFLHGSKPCLYKASTFGQKKVSGFFGTTTDFVNSGGATYCSECDGFSVSDEQSSFSGENSRFMCQVSPKGYIFGVDYLKKIESDNVLCFPIRVKVGELHFPTNITSIQDLSMVLINRQMRARLLNVSKLELSNKHLNSRVELFGKSRYDIQTICIERNFEQLGGFGRIVSYNAFSKVIVVSKELGLDFSQSLIPTTAQLYVGDTFSENILLDSISGQPLSAQIESLVDMGNFQHLTLRKAIGISTEIYSITSINGTKIIIEMVSGSQIQNLNISSSIRQKFIVRKSTGDYNLVQESSFIVSNFISNHSMEIMLMDELKSYFSVGSIIEFSSQNIYIGSSLIEITYYQQNYMFKEYDPSDRWKSLSYQPPPDILQIEYALFVVPVRKTYEPSSSPLDLCPKQHPFIFNTSFPDFTIEPQRQHYFQCYAEPAKDCSQFPEQSYCSAIKSLDGKPTYILELDQVLQMNNKWKTMGNSLEKDISVGGSTEVEYKYSFTQEYHFQHDSSSNDVDSEFTKGININSNSTTNIFNGRLNFLGRSIDDVGIPAHSPLLNFQVQIDLSPFCGEDIIKYGDGILQDIFSGILKETGSWRYVLRENSKTKEGAQEYAKKVFTSPVTISWDLSTLGEYNSNNMLTLSPGYEFDFRATLTVTSVYNSGFTGNADIKEVKVSLLKTSVEKTALDFANRNKLVLNYVIEIDLTQSNQVFLIAESSVLLDLMTDVGGAMGVLSLGALFLKVWQSIAGQPSVFLRDVIIADERKEERRKNSPTLLSRIGSIIFGRKNNKVVSLANTHAVYELK